jgi:hypothetical protein
VTHRPLVRLRATRDFERDGVRYREGEALLLEQRIAELLIACGDLQRIVTKPLRDEARPIGFA